jgi:streptogramin lyase
MSSTVSIREIGIPVRSVNRAHLYAGRNREGKPRLFATMSQQADNFFVLVIDPETGAFRQLTVQVPESNYTTAAFMSRTGTLYIGAAHSGQLFCFDPEKDDLVDLGTINPSAAIFPCRIDEDAEGRVWIGSYGTADLTSYDPAKGEFTRYGRMDEVDMYCSPLVNADGTVACHIMQTRPHVAVLDPKTGEKRVVGPVITRGEGTLTLHRGGDGRLYIESSAGSFRLEGMTAVPVEKAVPAASEEPRLSDGSAFRFADAAQHVHRVLEIRRPDGAVKTFDLKYHAAGTDIFYLHAGPDECLYGSSILPERLFRYNPKNRELIDLGVCSRSTGEAYSMANLDGKMYISSYPGARVSVYDPSQSYRFGEGPGDNPRDLGRIDDISYRPRSTLAGPLGRVWLVSIPDYGMWGGPLSHYDPQTGEKKTYYRTFGDGSCYTLAHLQDQALIAVGTSIAGGSGTQPKVDQAVLFLWDYAAEKKAWEGTLDRPVSAFNALTVGPDGRLYGTVHGKGVQSELFVFDPVAREFTDRVPLPEGSPLDLGLQNGPDGQIYGFTSACIYRLDPGSLRVEVVTPLEPKGRNVAGPIVGQDIYFAKGHRLMAAKIF